MRLANGIIIDKEKDIRVLKFSGIKSRGTYPE